MYASELREEISQGDIFTEIPFSYVFFYPNKPEPHTDVRHRHAAVLSHDCDIDKAEFLIVAEIRPLSEIAENSQGNIRHLKTRNTFYLAGTSGMPESYIDFRRMDRLHKAVLQRHSQEGKRLASLTDEARLALQRQVAIFFGYGR